MDMGTLNLYAISMIYKFNVKVYAKVQILDTPELFIDKLSDKQIQSLIMCCM